MAPGEVPLQEHLEALAEERLGHAKDLFEAHKAVHEQEAIARIEAAKRVDSRLEQLNELRSEVITDRARFVSRETFEAEMRAKDERINALHDQITEWKGREKGLSLSASFIVGAIGFASTALAIYFALSG